MRSAPTASPVTVTAPPRARIGESLSSRTNSLNFLRLFFAVTVIAGHTVDLGPRGNDALRSNSSVGTLAVLGFFGISGYLIAASGTRNSVGRYLWQRFLRIFPGYWACLIVTAGLFGVIAWFHMPHLRFPHCGISCYVKNPRGPVRYVFSNSLLRTVQTQISGTPKGIRRALSWNGSTWTLFYEFLCYLIIAALAVTRLLSRRVLVLFIAVGTWVAAFVATAVPSFNVQFSVFHNWLLLHMFTFAPLFLTGSVLYLFREKVPDSGLLALASTAVFVASFFIPLGRLGVDLALTSSMLFAPAVVYPVLWLGIHLPLQSVGARNDYSYGMYIYAYPVQQVLAIWGVPGWGYVPYLALALLCTAPFAVASWWVVERPALRLKRADPRNLWRPVIAPAEQVT